MALEEITIPYGVYEIPWQTFKDCTALKTVKFAENTEEVDVIEIENFGTIGYQAFAGCVSLEEFVFPDWVKSVGDSAFKGCTSLKKAEFNEFLETIGISVFYNCPSLLQVTVPESVTKIGKYAFAYTYNSAVHKLIPHPDFVITGRSDSAAQTYAQKNGLKFVADDPLENTSEIVDDYLTVGKAVTINGSAKGGSGEYTYSYYFKRAKNDTWKILGGQENTTATSVRFKPTEETIYDVRVIVTDSEGNKDEACFTIAPLTNIIANTSTVSSNKINLGGTVTINGSIEASITHPSSTQYPTETYTYYFKRADNTAWKVIGQEDTTDMTARFRPTAKGKYDVKVVAKYAGLSDEKTFVVTVK